MKKLELMDEAELLTLTDIEIEVVIDYKCALEGIDLLPDNPGDMPIKSITPPDLIGYQIGGVVVTNADHAQRILEAIYSDTVYISDYQSNDYGNWYLKKLTRELYNAPKIETAKYHSEEQFKLLKDDFKAYSKKKDKWEKLSIEYKSAVNARKSIVDGVMDTINEARNKSYNRGRLRDKFNQYLELAEGNKAIALTFLLNVISLEGYPELLEEFQPDPEVVND